MAKLGQNGDNENNLKFNAMSTLPLTEAILLEIHQSVCLSGYPTTEKNKFATAQMGIGSHLTMAKEVLDAIFKALSMDERAKKDAQENFMEFANAQKFLELNTWTFGADQRQVVWAMLGSCYVPVLARYIANWSLAKEMDQGMPAGRFWYLPELREKDGQPSLYLPVAQVVDWLLDLLGMPIEDFADQRSVATDGVHEGLRRSLYNWRSDTSIRPDTIRKYFEDGTSLQFQGAFALDTARSPDEQFADAINFVKRKKLTSEALRLEIPMNQVARLDALLEGRADVSEQAAFVDCLVKRYAAPTLDTIRQRLLVARAVQDGYVRLLKFLFPGVDRQSADAHSNKLLQLLAIYKLVYNLTIEAWRHCGPQDETAENAWFEQHLPQWAKPNLFLCVLPSRRSEANMNLAHLLTRRFHDMQAGAELEDVFPLDDSAAAPIIKSSVESTLAVADELNSELHLVERMKASSPWRALQRERRFWVVREAAQHSTLSPRAMDATIQRLHELAETPAQKVEAIVFELDAYFNVEPNCLSDKTQAEVQSLLGMAEASEGYGLWEAVILQYKAKHLLACNEFEGAGKLFRAALVACLERNYGPLRGEVARDCLALEVANQKLIPGNHEKYYREMLAGGMMKDCEKIPSLEDTARWASSYFWGTLYKNYASIPREEPRASDLLKKVMEELKPLVSNDDLAGLQVWIAKNRQILASRLPGVESNSVLMALVKMCSHLMQEVARIRQIYPIGIHDDLAKPEALLARWLRFIGQLAVACPKQLNITDLKGQTPLMMMAESGDAKMVEIMLRAGADPDLQDRLGMTALHSACKSHDEACVDALLDHPCKLDKVTVEKRSPLHTASWAGNVHAVKRLSEMAPSLVRQRDTGGLTPLELAEHLMENPDELNAIVERRAQDGNRCATVQELKTVVQILESAV